MQRKIIIKETSLYPLSKSVAIYHN